MSEQTQTTMSAARLAELRERMDTCYQLHMDETWHADAVYADVFHDYFCDVGEALADNAHLRAELAAAREFARFVAEVPLHQAYVGRLLRINDKAHALLAKSDE